MMEGESVGPLKQQHTDTLASERDCWASPFMFMPDLLQLCVCVRETGEM